MKHCLIDGDTIAYRCAASVEKVKYLVEGPDHVFQKRDTFKEATELGGTLWSRRELGTLEEAVLNVNSVMRKIAEATAPSDPEIYLSPAVGNFRDRIATIHKYKGNRDQPKPTFLGEIRDYLLSLGAIVVEGEEADDSISVVAYGMGDWPFEGMCPYIVVSNDKDLKQIPGTHYNWVEGRSFEISVNEARRALWVQALCGDTTDNVKGCWRIGETKADKIYDLWLSQGPIDDKGLFQCLVAEYEKSQKIPGCPYKSKKAEDVARENLSLVRLRTEGNEELWTP